jgi:hypothetical protein
MRRTAIAAVWIAGATVPLCAAVVFLFGCCVLPFHAYIHKVMPMCRVAADVMRGEFPGHHDGASQPLPAKEKQEPVKRTAIDLSRTPSHAAAVTRLAEKPSAGSPAGYRSFIALGALRCDHDVGLYLLAGLLLI